MNGEIRSFGELAAPRIIGEGRTIEGYAIVFNQESRVMFDTERKKFFVEVIEPRAVTEEFLRECDIKLLVNHNKERLLGRSFRGIGSLEIEIDDYGVKYRTEAARDAEGDATLEHIRRGDYFGSSFTFFEAKDGVTYTRVDDNVFKRTISKFARITDFAVVTDPAYFGTTVTSRNWEEPAVEPISSGWTPEMQRMADDLKHEIENIYSNF